ncbi:MAG: hypothetical protein FWD37_04365 [Methanomassiliicoccaceae archaeon]|nr:hypothetical protein [Methanomassiliicoccaceae archaeon]
MTIDIRELMHTISKYQTADANALNEIVQDHDPYDKDGEYGYDIGLYNMREIGVCTSDGDELKGRIEAFEAVLTLIEDLLKGG